MDQNKRDNSDQSSRDGLLLSAQIAAIRVSGCGYSRDLEELQFKPVERQHILPEDAQVYDSFFAVPVVEGRTVGAEILARGVAVVDSARSIMKGLRRRLCADFYLSQIYAEIEQESSDPGAVTSVEAGSVDELYLWMNVIDDLTELGNILAMYQEIVLKGGTDRWSDFLERVIGKIKLSVGIGE